MEAKTAACREERDSARRALMVFRDTNPRQLPSLKEEICEDKLRDLYHD